MLHNFGTNEQNSVKNDIAIFICLVNVLIKFQTDKINYYIMKILNS